MGQGTISLFDEQLIDKGGGNVPPTIGARIRRARQAMDMNQGELGTAANVSQNYISDIERDKADPVVSVVIKIAKTLGVSMDYLAPEMGVEDPTPYSRKRLTKEAEMAQRIIETLPYEERKDCINLLTTMMQQYQRRRKENEDIMRGILKSIERVAGREMRRTTAQELGIIGLFDDE